MAKSRLHQLSELGQSVWVDSISRDWLRDGTLERFIREDAVVGVTSNPTIFDKAITHGDAYDEQLRELTDELDDAKEIFWRLAERDICQACDLLRPIWDEGQGQDGYVSIEVDPDLAYEEDAQYEQAKVLHELIDRPNLFVKIPGTKPGLGAIEDMIAAGKNMNVTLIFSLERHKEVMEAYIRGLERLLESGGGLRRGAPGAGSFSSRA